MARVAITGGYGFLGWHLACRIRALTGLEPRRLGRSDFDDPARLAQTVGNADVIYHLAGVNRSSCDSELERENRRLAESLARALEGSSAKVVFANTIHQAADTPYGRSKAAAAACLAQNVKIFADVRLPNIFGEHGRPHYNSFVATFCHEIVHQRRPVVKVDHEIPLLHAQSAAEALMSAAEQSVAHVAEPPGEKHLVSEVLNMIDGFHTLYARRGEIPDLSTPYATDLFNTYRSHLFPIHTPVDPGRNSDSRGTLVEALRSHGGRGQAYVSTTVPGATRGEHYHLRKVERFFVLKGEAEIQLRRLLTPEVVTFRVSGQEPSIVDMPTLWAHNMTNVGDDELLTLFWSNQLLDRDNPDQYAEKVEVLP